MLQQNCLFLSCLCLNNHSAVHALNTVGCKCIFLLNFRYCAIVLINLIFKICSVLSQPLKKMTAAQKSLAKVDKTGMKSLSAFFSPKVKQEMN